jgi:signal transduction histidine kinase
MLDDLGRSLHCLVLQQFIQQTKIKWLHIVRWITRRFSDVIETTIFRDVQEALTNIARHAKMTM